METFRFEAWWLMEEIFETELEYLKSELEKWATRIGLSRNRKKEYLNSKLVVLMEAERTDNNLAELIDTKI
ncbi:hypothetical protein EPI10_025010 [Gossypium australe]|uniref:Uncharacterized protein n=1 Tax=Gossypium australe TaxID=47621 RepID=A0A5B6VYM1_9ROSI|nr:hypothetical protein EPI10_025010 [Gossypium australe]